MERIQAIDTPYTAARRLADCTDSTVRNAALAVLTDLIEKVDHSADMFGALGLLMDMDRRRIHGAEVLKLRDRCQGDLDMMARQVRGQKEPKPEAKATVVATAPGVSLDEIVSELADRLEAVAITSDSVELLDDAEAIRKGGKVTKTAQKTALLAEILQKRRLGDNYKGVNKVVFAA